MHGCPYCKQACYCDCPHLGCADEEKDEWENEDDDDYWQENLEDCRDCGRCGTCIERTKAYWEDQGGGI